MARAIAIWLIGAMFLVGGLFHLKDIILGGWLPYRFAPLALNWFWTLLLPLDLAVVVLLIRRRRISALWLGLAVMLADVAVNAYALAGLGFQAFAYSLPLQALFLGYLIGVLPFVYRR